MVGGHWSGALVRGEGVTPPHRLTMELDLQSYLGSCVKLYSLAETPQLPPPPHLGSNTRALLVSQDRRHLFITPCSRPLPFPSTAGLWTYINKDDVNTFSSIWIICLMASAIFSVSKYFRVGRSLHLLSLLPSLYCPYMNLNCLDLSGKKYLAKHCKIYTEKKL
jgi:hypothetical protein